MWIFESSVDQANTVNVERSRSMSTNLFWIRLYYQEPNNMWFQRHGAMFHTAHATFVIVLKRFQGMVTSFGDNMYCAIENSFDFFLWNLLMLHMYGNNHKGQNQHVLSVRVTYNCTFWMRFTHFKDV